MNSAEPLSTRARSSTLFFRVSRRVPSRSSRERSCSDVFRHAPRRYYRSTMRPTLFLVLVALVSCSKTRKSESSTQPLASASAVAPAASSAPPAKAPEVDERALLRTAEEGLRSMLAACSKPRKRGPEAECTDFMYSAQSMAAALRSQLATAPRTAKGWTELESAMGFIDACCGCAPEGAKACPKVEAPLKELGKILKK